MSGLGFGALNAWETEREGLVLYESKMSGLQAFCLIVEVQGSGLRA